MHFKNHRNCGGGNNAIAMQLPPSIAKKVSYAPLREKGFLYALVRDFFYRLVHV